MYWWGGFADELLAESLTLDWILADAESSRTCHVENHPFARNVLRTAGYVGLNTPGQHRVWLSKSTTWKGGLPSCWRASCLSGR